MMNTITTFIIGLIIGIIGTGLVMWNNFSKGIKAKLADKLQDGAKKLNK